MVSDRILGWIFFLILLVVTLWVIKAYLKGKKESEKNQGIEVENEQ